MKRFLNAVVALVLMAALVWSVREIVEWFRDAGPDSRPFKALEGALKGP